MLQAVERGVLMQVEGTEATARLAVCRTPLQHPAWRLCARVHCMPLRIQFQLKKKRSNRQTNPPWLSLKMFFLRSMMRSAPPGVCMAGEVTRETPVCWWQAGAGLATAGVEALVAG